ncbi:tRNA (adenosine(37)-N6)-threonylcarbamoyltransferase complex ATPase subunit type 1 TsaE [Aliiroseovarius marinus]|uniref:tRNA (adenosine(37)-N6)-threonylcarbamoyltransferase complex ATPase subunit type 1 TsaE n=1 Tax=Aliiroseovarius marinus TaxID=2500159 RepID=UPI003D7D3E9B
MGKAFYHKLHLSTATDTQDFAIALAARLKPGDTILLEGQIGAGKTHFARAFIQSLLAAHGLMEDVPSPTFTIVQTYEAGGVEVWHADLYRLTHPDEVEELGLVDAFTSAICLVEWPDRLGELLPADALKISFSPHPEKGEDYREANLTSTDPKWFEALRGLL